MNYVKDNNPTKNIFICPLPEIIIDSSLINFYEKKLNISTEDIKDSVSKYLRVQYNKLSKNSLRPKKATLCESDLIVDISSLDTCYLNKIKSKNYNNTSDIYINYPDKSYLNTIGIKCDFGLFISDVTLFTITRGPPKSNCRICDIIFFGAHVPIVEAAIKGKYILWDYNNNRAEIYGEFRSKFENIGLDEEENINKTVYPIIARILYKSSYWKISSIYYKSSKKKDSFYY